MSFLSEADPKISKIVRNELGRQRSGLEMIASENFASPAVLEVMGSVLTNKYSEGYPGRRYYSGNRFADEGENLAIARAKKLFGAEHANVQPHSGSQANAAACLAILDPGDRILSMSLAHGGHLTHGSPRNFSGKIYKIAFYGVDEKTGRLDMDAVSRAAKKARPKLIIAGASSYPRQIDFRAFQKIADEAGAYLLADMAHIAGLVAVGLHPDPVPFCDIVTTTTHKTLRGPRGGIILCKSKDRWHDKYHPKSKKNLAQLIDSAVFPGVQGGPMENVIAAKAVAFKEAMSPGFKVYQKQVLKNARALAESLMAEGLDLVSGGTDNHLVLIDVTKAGLSGQQAEDALERAGIYANKNVIPYDRRKADDPSGLRLGTPALTTRGMREKEMKIIGGLIAGIIRAPKNQLVRKKAARAVRKRTGKYPLYEDLKI